MARVQCVVNEQNLAGALLGPANMDLRRILELLVSRGVTEARGRAQHLTYHLRDGIDGGVGLGEHGLIARIWSKDFKTNWHEYGTRRMPAHPFLVPTLHSLMPGATITRGERG